MNRIVTKLSIVHVTRDANGRALTYRGDVRHGARVVASTPVMNDGLECLYAARKLEARYIWDMSCTP